MKGVITASTASRVVHTYLVIWALPRSASLIWGVNTLFLLDAGLDSFLCCVSTVDTTARQPAEEY